MVPPGQRMNIWLDLEAAEAHGTVNSDIFQVLRALKTDRVLLCMACCRNFAGGDDDGHTLKGLYESMAAIV